MINWTAEDKSSVHRVVTRQLQVLNSHEAILKSLDSEIVSLLLAKRVVQKARISGAASKKWVSDRLRKDIGKAHLDVLSLLRWKSPLYGFSSVAF